MIRWRPSLPRPPPRFNAVLGHYPAIEQWNSEPLHLPAPPIIWANKEDGNRIEEFFRTGDLNILFKSNGS